MPLKVVKQKGESSKSLVNRFIQRVRLSGILLEARKRMFYQRPKSKQLKRRSALRRIQKEKEWQELKKLGKIK